MRVVKSAKEFFDIMDQLPNGRFISIGYVSAANLNLPKEQRRNPETGRMKGYANYSTLGLDQGVGALVKLSSYKIPYLRSEVMKKRYGEYKDKANDIRARFGIDPIGQKDSHSEKIGYGSDNLDKYRGENDELRSHTYTYLNSATADIKSTYFAINNEGHIMQELSREQVKPYLKKRDPDGVIALRRMNADEKVIKDYISQINDLRFNYMKFESDSILWIAATVNGEKIVYINDMMQRAVDGINIRPEEFRAIARERYKIALSDLTEGISRRSVRLTENQLRAVITESVKKILRNHVRMY